MSRPTTSAALWLLAALAATLLWWQTPYGLGLEGDSADYVSMARQIARGEVPRFDAAGGRRLPMTQFPPGYPLVLAVGEWLGVGVLPFARGLHCALLAATVWLVGAVALRHTRSPPVALAAAGYVAVSPQMQLTFASLMSEALFVPLVLLAVHVTSGSVGKAARPFRGLAGAVWRIALLGSLPLVRYAGIFVVVALCVARFTSDKPRHGVPRLVAKAVKPLASLLLAVAPAVAWSLCLRRLGAEPSRVLRWHPPDAATLRRSLSAVGGWAVPLPVGAGGIITGVAGAAVVAALSWAVVKGLKRFHAEVSFWSLVLLAYVAGLWASRALVDEAMPMGVRLWLPALPLAVLLAADTWRVSFGRAATRIRRVRPAAGQGRVAARLRDVAVWIAAAVLCVAAVSAIRQAAAVRRDGIGYASPVWHDSPTLSFVRSLPPTTPVVSNAADAVSLLLGRDATPLPMTIFRTSGNDNVRWREQLREQGKRLRAADGVIAYFDAVDRRDFLVREPQLRDVLRVEPTAILPDGRAYRVTGIR